MSVPVVAFFNNKGGVGKTSLVYHLAWKLADIGTPVLAADLDPQANLTAAFLDGDAIEEIWTRGSEPRTIFEAIEPISQGTGDIAALEPPEIAENLTLLPGDLRLSSFEDELSSNWPGTLDGKPRSFRVVSALWRVMQDSARRSGATVILMDLGPNLGAINRACLVSADFVVIPLAPDLFSLQGLRNLGPAFRRWRSEWKERLAKKPADLRDDLPSGAMKPLGYVVLQHAVRLDRPVRAYQKWMDRIPIEYHQHVLDEASPVTYPLASDPGNLASLKHYRSLMPLAQEARKPVFHLKPADGAIGAHFDAVRESGRDFENLARRIAERAGIAVPEPLTALSP